MATIICEHCKAEVNIPAGYNAPYIKCSVCGIHLKNVAAISEAKKFNRVFVKNNNAEAGININRAAANDSNDIKNDNAAPSSSSSDKYQRIIDSIGEDGKKKAYELVSEYICKTSPKAKATARAKAIQALMRYKYPLALATGAIELAERSPEVLALGKSKSIKKAIFVVFIAVILIAGALTLL